MLSAVAKGAIRFIRSGPFRLAVCGHSDQVNQQYMRTLAQCGPTTRPNAIS